MCEKKFLLKNNGCMSGRSHGNDNGAGADIGKRDYSI